MDSSNSQSKLIIDIQNISPGTRGHECGYCKNKNGSFSTGFSVDQYPAALYEKMMKEGWRRCGDYTYKPNLSKSCCKLYTIKLDVEKFKINKKQRQIMRRFRKYLSGEYEENLKKEKEQANKIKIEEEEKNDTKSNDIYFKDIQNIVNKYVNEKLYVNAVKLFYQNEIIVNSSKISLNRNNNRNFGDYSSNILILIQTQITTWAKKNNTEIKAIDVLNHLYKSFADFSNSSPEFKYEITLSEKTGHLNFIVKNKEEYQKFLESIVKHNGKTKEVKTNKKKDTPKKYEMDYFKEIVTEPEIYYPLKHTYTVELTKNIGSTPEKLDVYSRYQQEVHKDPFNKNFENVYNSAWGQTNLTSPPKSIPLPKDLNTKTNHPEIYPTSYGTYNFIHRIDGKIIAVGVWDILPTSLSSVYLYYDPNFSFLDLGVFTAIREIEYVKSFHELIDPNFKYYMMGFYTTTCAKLKYKGEYHPSDILDPFTMNYVPLDEVKEIISDGKLHKLSKEKGSNNYGITIEEARTMAENLLVQIETKMYKLVNIISLVFTGNENIVYTMIQNLIIAFGKEFIKYVIFTIIFG